MYLINIALFTAKIPTSYSSEIFISSWPKVIFSSIKNEDVYANSLSSIFVGNVLWMDNT